MFHFIFGALLGEWNQHRGPFSNNTTAEILMNGSWLDSSKSLRWKTATPLGFSSFTTANEKAFTLIAEEDEDGLMREVCIALDLRTGKRLWSSLLGVMDTNPEEETPELPITMAETDLVRPHR